ncbi:hypothetical protein YB2330_004551 [Saitoella coloradoensis]
MYGNSIVVVITNDNDFSSMLRNAKSPLGPVHTLLWHNGTPPRDLRSCSGCNTRLASLCDIGILSPRAADVTRALPLGASNSTNKRKRLASDEGVPIEKLSKGAMRLKRRASKKTDVPVPELLQIPVVPAQMLRQVCPSPPHNEPQAGADCAELPFDMVENFMVAYEEHEMLKRAWKHESVTLVNGTCSA